MRIALVGYMGSGKSTVGKKLAQHLNLPFIDLDAEIELHEGRSISAIFADMGEPGFRILESEELKSVFQKYTNCVLSTGGGTPCFFNQMNLLNEHCRTVFLNCSAVTLMNRITGTEGTRPLMTSSERIESHLAERISFYQKAHLTLSGELPVKRLVEQIAQFAQRAGQSR